MSAAKNPSARRQLLSDDSVGADVTDATDVPVNRVPEAEEGGLTSGPKLRNLSVVLERMEMEDTRLGF